PVSDTFTREEHAGLERASEDHVARAGYGRLANEFGLEDAGAGGVDPRRTFGPCEIDRVVLLIVGTAHSAGDGTVHCDRAGAVGHDPQTTGRLAAIAHAEAGRAGAAVCI